MVAMKLNKNIQTKSIQFQRESARVSFLVEMKESD
jgi:hypothetical protein